MSQAITTRGALVTNRSSQLEELVAAHHLDDNSDDMAAVSLAGLEVEIELPKELVEPIEPSVEVPGTTA